jgi:hypothetical protein
MERIHDVSETYIFTTLLMAGYKITIPFRVWYQKVLKADYPFIWLQTARVSEVLML